MNLSKKSMAIATATLLLGGAFSGGVCAQASAPMASASGSMASAADKTFVQMAAIGGMTEVEAGKLAQQNAAGAAVKDFGTHMVDDHTKAGDELAQIANSKGITPPARIDTMHQTAIDKLSAMKGASFDKAFMTQMIGDHKKTIALFEKESKSGKDADLKAFATKTLPTLRSHLAMAQKTARMPA